MSTRQQRLTRHHRLPRSRGGNGLDDNISHVPNDKHTAWHALFGTDPPEAVMLSLMDTWLPRGYFTTIRCMREDGTEFVVHAE